MFDTDGDLWKIISEIFDSQSPSLRQIMGNIEMRCQSYCLNLKKCIDFCRFYEYTLPCLKPVLGVYLEKLGDLGEQSLTFPNFKLSGIPLRLHKCIIRTDVPLETLIKLRVELSQEMTVDQLCDALEKEIKSAT